VKLRISLEDFLFLNQGLNGNYTNLFAEGSYYVAPVGNISDYPGHPDYVPPEESVTTIPSRNVPAATFTASAITGLTAKLPLFENTRTDCFNEVDESKPHVNTSRSFAFSTCEILAEVWSISPEEMHNW
jgi:hypothetical protein